MNEKEAIKFLQSHVDLIKNDYPADQKGETEILSIAKNGN